MRNCLVVFIAAAIAVVPAAIAATYSTDATMSLQKGDCTYNVDVRVCELTGQGGNVTERVIARPRITSSPGVPATLYTGPGSGDPEYKQKENVTVEMSWPYPDESETAFCTVTIRRGDDIVSKSRMQLKVEGPGRVPLVLSAQDVDPKSVRVTQEKSGSFVLLELAGKTRQEVKKLAAANYGNKVQVRDLRGHLNDGGLSFGSYHEIGLALQCKNEDEARRVAGLFRGEEGQGTK